MNDHFMNPGLYGTFIKALDSGIWDATTQNLSLENMILVRNDFSARRGLKALALAQSLFFVRRSLVPSSLLNSYGSSTSAYFHIILYSRIGLRHPQNNV